MQAVAMKVNIIREGSKVLQLLKQPSDDNTNNDDASPDINDVQDIDSYDAVVVAGICLTYILDNGTQDQQAFTT